MLERDIESWSSRKARDAGWWNRKFKSPGNRSVPDRIFGKGGRIFWVEFKATGKKPTELQKEEHDLMRQHGLTVYWTDCREGFAYIMELESDWLIAPTDSEGFGVAMGPAGVLLILPSE